MAIKTRTYYIIILMSVILCGCETYISEVKLPEYERKLTIAGFISPSDSITTVFVGSTRPLFGELNKEESPGIISGTISNGTKTVELDTVRNGLYFSREEMPIEPGNTYFLRVESDLGMTAEAECTVPDAKTLNLEVDNVTFERHEAHFGENQFHVYYTLDCTISFDDPRGEPNFYRITGTSTSYYKSLSSGKQYKNSYQLYFGKEFFSDQGNDGSRFSITQSAGSYSADMSGYDSAFLKIYLYRTEKSYQLYHRSLKNYPSDENPFAEATPIFSNVKGGLGIFTSYIVDSLIYRLK